jgi:hypothetical protein
VWALVSEVTKMGEWSPETVTCEWLGDTTEAVPGARFRGHNRNGNRRWSTTGTVVTAELGVEFTWEVTTFANFPVARWSYVFEPLGDRRCRVTESTLDQRGWLVRKAGALLTGVEDRATHNEETMNATLARIKETAEFIVSS